MAKKKEPIITVRTVFVGTRTDREAFIDLILEKEKSGVDREGYSRYNRVTPSRGVQGGMENHHDHEHCVRQS